jgi:hypothetical protein
LEVTEAKLTTLYNEEMIKWYILQVISFINIPEYGKKKRVGHVAHMGKRGVRMQHKLEWVGG